MKHEYIITGMTCSGCSATVKKVLSAVPGVQDVSIDLPAGRATIQMQQHVPTHSLQQALATHPKYKLSEPAVHMPEPVRPAMEQTEQEEKTWFQTYKPILLIFFYILSVSVLVEVMDGSFDRFRWMHHFMAGFFLVFSFFKLLDLRGFAESYSSYDIVARRWYGWGYVYAFVELLLGFAFLLKWYPVVTHAVTFVVMSVSIIGVLQSVLNKRKIRCACLGAVFNLPMSTVTIIEDALMIGMSGIMLIEMYQMAAH